MQTVIPTTIMSNLPIVPPKLQVLMSNTIDLHLKKKSHTVSSRYELDHLGKISRALSSIQRKGGEGECLRRATRWHSGRKSKIEGSGLPIGGEE